MKNKSVMACNNLFILKLCFFALLILSCVHTVFCTDCKAGDYDLQLLNKFSPWTENDGNNTFYISICKKLQSSFCPDGTAVCMKDQNGNAHSIGNYSTSLNYTVTLRSKDVLLSFQGGQCTQNGGVGVKKTFIFLKCGRTLGSPKHIGVRYGCDYHFEWYTTAVCNTGPATEKEVPCYIFNGQEKFDLSPLIKITGAYLVSSSNNRKIYINVCRGISQDASVTECIAGSGACSVINGQGQDLGQPEAALQKTSDGDLRLFYTTETKIAGVSQHTTILFSCPTNRGASKHPELISDFSGEYIIKWVTEHACAQSYLTSKTCKLTSQQHDIDIDLTPLKKTKNSLKRYSTLSKDGQYKYFINICDAVGITCGNHPNSASETTVCQTKPGGDFSASLGNKDGQVLRYADGELTLTYTGSDTCHISNLYKTTVISFHCNKTAGNGSPAFNYNTTCTYFFDWDTDRACPDHPNIEECRTSYNGKIYDLSSLVKENGNNWQAVNSIPGKEGLEVEINMCHHLLTSTISSNCQTESAVCLKNKDNAFHNLGKYIENPTYHLDDHSIQIIYTEGDPCTNGKKMSSIIKLMCNIGDSTSGPVLTEISDDQCTYIFEWHISAACPLKHIMGDNCRITDVNTGISLDLTKLTKKDGYYTATIPQGHAYDYYINVCNEVKMDSGTCGDTPSAGVCQIEQSGSRRKYNTGKFSSKLAYFDGMINLTYSGGDMYRSTPPVPRSTEINFRCNVSAGIGNPVYVTETNKTYVFKWDTEYACLSRSVECIVRDDKTGKQYDLSRLTKTGTDNWHKSDGSRTYYINVCQSLNPIDPIVNSVECGEMAAVCVTTRTNDKQTVEHGSLGQVTTGPVIEDGNVQIVYKNGDSCVNGAGEITTYTTVIHFHCLKGAVENGPLTPVLNRPCEYTMMWQTEAACPIEEIVSTEQCVLNDTSSNFIFNFQHLQKKADEAPYSIKSLVSGKTYKLNICGGTNACKKIGNNKESSVCVDDGQSAGITLAKPKMEFSTEGKIRLVYYGPRLDNGNKEIVEILFTCDQSKEPGKFISAREMSDNHVVFEFVTAAACRPQPIECSAVDEEGEEYSLKPLADKNKAWEIVDPTRPDLRYYISVCKSLPASANSCGGVAIGGCQTSSERAKSYNMGFIQSMPVAVKNAVSLHYRNGDICHRGKPNQSHRSTNINFICSPHEHHPVFDGEETSKCEYLFSWSTPSACPVKQIIGKDCKVTDQVYNYEFDLSSLHKTSGSYSVTYNGYTYLINACGGITGAQGGCPANVGSCQTKNDKSITPINAGMANDKLMYNGGEITLKYIDGQHNDTAKCNRTTIIMFHCDHSTNGEKGPQHLMEDEEVCTTMFIWNTSAACPPHKIVDCTVFDNNGHEYDISSLALSSDNYNYIDPLDPKKKYILNVCRTLIHQKGETCPFNSASCLIDSSGDKPSFHNLGEVGDKPLALRDGKDLLLYYENGEPCNQGKNKTQTIIIFKCRPNAYDTRPTGHFIVDQCSHRFVWETQAACALDGTKTNVGKCIAKNPATGYEFDLSPLSVNGGYRISDTRSNNIYFLNVCGSLSKASCNANSGVCQNNLIHNSYKNTGNYNSVLQYKDGMLLLNYTNGDTCDGGYKMNTVINFVCAEVSGNPAFAPSSSSCTYVFNWETPLACENKVKCSVQNGSRIIDLSPLIKPKGHYLAAPDPTFGDSLGGQFYINPCRPLNPIDGVICPPESGACYIKDGKATGLGKVIKPPRMDIQSNKQVILEYTHGAACKKNQSRETVARILFTCKEGSSLGQPKLLALADDCIYLFIWETNLICPPQVETIFSNCTYYDSQTGQHFDLSSLKNFNSPVSDLGHSGTNYYVSFCQSLPQKKNTNYTVMAVDSNNKQKFYGTLDKGKFVMDGNNLNLLYESNESCNDASKKRSTEIVFKPECESTGAPRSLRFAGGDDCKLSFIMKTNLVCPAKVANCMLNTGDSLYDLSVLSREDSWNITSGGNSYWINICHSISGQSGCPSNANKDATICRKSADGMDILGNIDTQKLTRDSDGETIVLEYSQGTDACSHNRRRSDNNSAKTIIKFTCGSTIGQPKFVQVDEDCVFTFEWKSRLACKIKRESVKENGGKVEDPRTGGQIDLTKLNTPNYYRLEPPNNADKMEYLIQPAGAIHPDWSVSGANPCNGASVCQIKKTDSTYHKNLGLFSNRNYFIEDDVVEIQFTSNEKCVSQSNKNVTSALILRCQEDAVKTKPQFVYQTKNCFYYFKWDTYVACPQGDLIAPGGSKSNTVGVKPKTLGIVIGVFAGIIVICILLIVFHKQERRSACAFRVRRLFGRPKKETIYKYSMLSQDALEEGDDGNEDTITDNTDPGVSIANHNLPSYHDDSDEDLLI